MISRVCRDQRKQKNQNPHSTFQKHQINASSQLHSHSHTNTTTEKITSSGTHNPYLNWNKRSRRKDLDPIKTKEEILCHALAITERIRVCSVDIQNDKERAEVYKLLTQNYVDDDNMFRFDYSESSCRALTPPGYHKDWHVGVRQSATSDWEDSSREFSWYESKRTFDSHGRDQFPVCTQEASRQASCTRVDQGGHKTYQSSWYLQAAYGFLVFFVNTHTLTHTTTQIHRRCGSTETGTGSILASLLNSKKLIEVRFSRWNHVWLGTYDQVVPCCEKTQT